MITSYSLFKFLTSSFISSKSLILLSSRFFLAKSRAFVLISIPVNFLGLNLDA